MDCIDGEINADCGREVIETDVRGREDAGRDRRDEVGEGRKNVTGAESSSIMSFFAVESKLTISSICGC